MKKSNKILMILGIIICLAIIGICIYLVFDVTTNDKNESNNDVNEQIKEPNIDTKEQELEVTEEDNNIAINLLKPFDRYKDYLAYDQIGYIYTFDELNIDNLSNDIILEVSLYKYVRENKNIYDNYYSDIQKNININVDTFNKTVQSIFGNIKYENGNITLSCTYGSATYDETQNNYIYSGQACGGTLLPYIESKIIQVKKYNDCMEIIEKIAYISYENSDSTINQLIYNNPKDMKLVDKRLESSSEDIFDKYSDKLTSYKWTFKKDENNYYFDKIEKLN